jgi:hypothetical protein
MLVSGGQPFVTFVMSCLMLSSTSHHQDVSKINLKCLENTYCEFCKFVSEIWHVIVCYLTCLEVISVMYEGIMFSVEMQCYKIKFVKDRE